MKSSGCFFASILLCCNAVMAGFSGSDNFDDGAINTNLWNDPLIVTGIVEETLVETNGHLHFSSTEIDGRAILPWKALAPFDQDWEVQFEATLPDFVNNSEQQYDMALQLTPHSAGQVMSNRFTFGMTKDESNQKKFFENIATNSVEVHDWDAVRTNDTATLRIRWESSTSNLYTDVSTDSGTTWTNLWVPVTNPFSMSPSDHFSVQIYGASTGREIAISDNLYCDNFQAVTFPYNAVITNCYPVASGFALEWIPLAGLDSVVKWSTNLVNTPFTDLSPALPYPQNSYTDTVHGAEDECFYQVEVRQEDVELELDIFFNIPDGYTIADETGLTYYFGGNILRDPSFIYPPEYWGTHPLYLPGNLATIGISVPFNDTSDTNSISVLTEINTLNLDGSKGTIIYGPTVQTIPVIITEGYMYYHSSVAIPSEAKGLFLVTAELYWHGIPIMTKEAIFCPPDASVLDTP